MPLSFLIIIEIFRFVGATVEEYIAEGITYMAKYLELSDAMAAVTLLALANGYIFQNILFQGWGCYYSNSSWYYIFNYLTNIKLTVQVV